MTTATENQIITIRMQKDTDTPQIFKLNIIAFKAEDEAYLVNRIRESNIQSISLVAELGQQIVGHLLLSEMHTTDNVKIRIFGLAPMAVLPGHQKKGIGRKLIAHAIKLAKEAKINAIFVLGHPNYYQKFGFVPAKRYDISTEYNVPDEVFMVLDLFDTGLKILSGKTVCYSMPFSEL